MNTQDLLQLHRQMCEAARRTMEAKNHDYAGAGGATPFANFEVSGALGLCSTAQGILVRLGDKMRRLSTFADCGEFKVADEKIDDTLEDAINYLVIFRGWLRELEERKDIEADAQERAALAFFAPRGVEQLEFDFNPATRDAAIRDDDQ